MKSSAATRSGGGSCGCSHAAGGVSACATGVRAAAGARHGGGASSTARDSGEKCEGGGELGEIFYFHVLLL